MAKSRAELRRERRIRAAVELRAKGFSLRAIAASLDVHHDTIREDLRRWTEMQKVSDLPVGNPTKSTGNPTAESDNNVRELRRRS